MSKFLGKVGLAYVTMSVLREYAVYRLNSIPETDTFFALTRKIAELLDTIPFLLG